jgi:branched-chain amino acid transport system ATP-binding protein
LSSAAAHPADAAPRAGEPLLAARSISKRFGALQVLDDVTLEVAEGEALGIVGPNGAGKTTLLDLIAGALQPDQGNVEFDRQPITSRGAAARSHLGIGRTHQVPRPFHGMTVFENALVAATMGAGLRGSAAQGKALESLERTGMLPLGNRPADTLGLLDRKRLELARALATAPRLLLLDEIAGGLTEAETHALVDQIAQLKAAGMTIIWIEHVVHALLRVAERLLCLAEGRVIADGDPPAVMRDPAVVEAYLGSAA